MARDTVDRDTAIASLATVINALDKKATEQNSPDLRRCCTYLTNVHAFLTAEQEAIEKFKEHVLGLE